MRKKREKNKLNVQNAHGLEKEKEEEAGHWQEELNSGLDKLHDPTDFFFDDSGVSRSLEECSAKVCVCVCVCEKLVCKCSVGSASRMPLIRVLCAHVLSPIPLKSKVG